MLFVKWRMNTNGVGKQFIKRVWRKFPLIFYIAFLCLLFISRGQTSRSKIEINLAYFSLLNSNKTHHSKTHQMIKMWILKIDVFKMTQIPGGSFIGRKSSRFYVICSHKFWEKNLVFSIITVLTISWKRDRNDNFRINNHWL